MSSWNPSYSVIGRRGSGCPDVYLPHHPHPCLEEGNIVDNTEFNIVVNQVVISVAFYYSSS